MFGSAAFRSFVRSTSVRSATAKLSSAAKTSRIRSSTPKPLSHRIFRCPVELSVCLEAVQPFRTATASALMTSSFVISPCNYGCLPKDIAMTVACLQEAYTLLLNTEAINNIPR